jgi:hypothetical protein
VKDIRNINNKESFSTIIFTKFTDGNSFLKTYFMKLANTFTTLFFLKCLFFSLLLTSYLHTNAQSWQWGKSGGTTDSFSELTEEVKSACTDIYGNVYMVSDVASTNSQVDGVPKQNYGSVYVASQGGFSGYISNLWYYNYALGTAEINRLVNKGPDTTMTGGDTINIKDADYLSLRWFFYGNTNAYN